jgi:hypothetical protein
MVMHVVNFLSLLYDFLLFFLIRLKAYFIWYCSITFSKATARAVGTEEIYGL